MFDVTFTGFFEVFVFIFFGNGFYEIENLERKKI